MKMSRRSTGQPPTEHESLGLIDRHGQREETTRLFRGWMRLMEALIFYTIDDLQLSPEERVELIGGESL